MKSIISLGVLIFSFFSGNICAQAFKTYTWNASSIDLVRAKVAAGDKSIASIVSTMKSTADGQVNRGLINVTQKTAGWEVYFPTDVPVTPNDYISFSTYYWPVAGHETDGTPWKINENSSAGGGINTAMRDKFDYPRIQSMQNIVWGCAKGYWVTNDVRYARTAAAQLRAFFITPATRMLPKLDHAQFGPFDPNYKSGSPYGMIDLMDFHTTYNCIELIRNSGEWTAADDAGMKDWAYQLTQWMTTSTFGIKEGTKINNNNHGIFYDILLLTQYLYLGNNYLGVNYIQKAKDYLINISTDYRILYLTKGTVSGTSTVVDGGMWKELSRSNASGYESMCMNGYAYLAAIAKKLNIDLFNWNYETTGNQSIREALEWVLPYLQGTTWPWGSATSSISAQQFLYAFWISSYHIPSHFKIFNNYILSQSTASTVENDQYNLFYPRPVNYYDDFVSVINPAKNRTTFRGGTWATAAGELQLSASSSALSNATPGNICLHTATVYDSFSMIANLKLTSDNATDGVGLVFLANCTASSTENYYYVLLSKVADESGIYKVKGNNTLTGTTRTKLASIPGTFTANTVYNVKVEHNAALTTVKINNTKVAQMTDTEFTNGKCGFCTQSGNCSILDVRVTKSDTNMLPFLTHTATQQDMVKVTTGGSFKITADAVDYDGSIAKVEFFKDDVKLGESTTEPYTYTLNNIPKGNSTIKIKATDDAGGESTTQLIIYTDAAPTAIASVRDEERLQVFPNPTSGEVHFQGIDTQRALLTVYDLMGKQVWQSDISDSKSANLAKLTDGIYCMRISSGNKIFNKKICIKK